MHPPAKTSLKCFLMLIPLMIIATQTVPASDTGMTVAAKSTSREMNGKRGYALIIGNSRYRSISPLKNPSNDATDIAATLETLGFDVTLKVDATHRVMEKEIIKFGRTLRKGGVGLFYFAGHGVQVAGRNYLIPVDADVDSESDIKFETVDAGRILGKMEDAGNGVNIIILDACRVNPFVSKFRTESRGLAKMEAPTGSILAYATGPGSVAADGEGRNGLYTEKLLKYLKQPGLSIEDCFKKVRIEVIEESEKKQVPWESSSLTANFYFISPHKVQVITEDTGPSESVEILFWESIKDSKDPIQYQFYIKKFPDGSFVDLARLYIKKYGDEKTLTVEKPIKTSKEKQPITKVPSPQKRDKSDKATSVSQIFKKHRIALLPSNFGSFQGVQTLNGINQHKLVLRAVKSIEDADIIYDYRDDKDSDKDKFWKRGSIFTDPELLSQSAIQFCRKIDVNLSLMIRTKVAKENIDADIDIHIYIIDLQKKTLYTYSVASVSARSYSHELEKTVKESLKNYLAGNKEFFEIKDI